MLDVELPEIDIYTQLFFGHSQLIIIIGLTQDTGKTAIFSRICRYRYYGVKRMLKVESPNTDMLLCDLLLITHHYTQSNSKTS